MFGSQRTLYRVVIKEREREREKFEVKKMDNEATVFFIGKEHIMGTIIV